MKKIIIILGAIFLFLFIFLSMFFSFNFNTEDTYSKPIEYQGESYPSFCEGKCGLNLESSSNINYNYSFIRCECIDTRQSSMRKQTAYYSIYFDIDSEEEISKEEVGERIGKLIVTP